MNTACPSFPWVLLLGSHRRATSLLHTLPPQLGSKANLQNCETKSTFSHVDIIRFLVTGGKKQNKTNTLPMQNERKFRDSLQHVRNVSFYQR